MIPIIIGSRGSPLAVAQTKSTMAALKAAWPGRNFEIHIIKTKGDQLSESPEAAGQELSKGLFTGELERALLDKKIDLAVHSLKDLPTEMTAGLTIAAVPKRADARDRLITREAKTIDQLPEGGVIATGSPRRAAQLLLARPDLRVVEIRGNIDTRLRKFRENGDWSALILAAAGLDRLQPDISGLVATALPLPVMLPAPGQGALALQTRVDAQDVIEMMKAVHHPVTSAAVVAERAFLHALGGGCREPVAAYAQPTASGLLHLGGVAWLFGETQVRRASLKGKMDQPERLGIDLAAEISR
jgi:hydroxymethylbilane synthase